MTDTLKNLEPSHSPITHNYFRGISASLIFLLVLAGISTENTAHKAVCICSAGLIAGSTVAIEKLRNKRTGRPE